MDYVGYRFMVDGDENRATLCSHLRAIVCDTLNLCASVGCACVTGTGDKLCAEAETGGGLPIYHSQGPSWSVAIAKLRNSVRLDVYYDGPYVSHELADLYEHISSLGWNCSRTGSSGAHSL